MQLRTFLKAQLSSIVATLTDFVVTFILTSILGYWYVFSSITGTVAGGISNFAINRIWVFNAKDRNKKIQIFKYVVIWSASLATNTFGVTFLTEVFNIHYLFSKAITATIVGVCFNFYFQHNFVFAKK